MRDRREKVSVVIPFGGDDPWRRTLFAWVVRRWQMTIPWCEIVVGQHPDQPFNRSAARNDGAARSSGDFLIFADADVIVDPLAVETAVSCGGGHGERWAYGFDVYYTMDEAWTRALLNHEPDVALAELTDEPDRQHVIHRHPGEIAAPCESACVIVTRRLWEESGGYDDGFDGWGGEDRAFAIVLERLAGKPARAAANALHLWHSTEGDGFEQPNWDRNARRLRDYQEGRR